MIKRGLIVFTVVNIVVVVLLGILAAMFQEKLGQFTGLIMTPLMIVPFIMAYVGHSISGATGNPFRGLIWGQTWWYFAGWLLALVGGIVILGIALGLGMVGLDLSMTEYLRLAAEQMAKQTGQSGQDVPEAGLKVLYVTGLSTAIAAPTIGAWFGGAVACLSSFPWLGWFTRRMLVYGRPATMWTLVILYAITSSIGGLLANPNDAAYSTLPVVARIGLMAFSGIAGIPLIIWLFLRTRSAVLPALVQASYQAIFIGAIPFLCDRVVWLAPPNGLLPGAGILVFGMALWLWKDPGGMDLAVAGVAFDGTPLTPGQMKALEAEQADPGNAASDPGMPGKHEG